MRLLLVLLLSGCAAAQDNPCTPYDAGRTDAMFGRQPNSGAYAQRCPRDASAASDYMAGWSIGASETSFRQPN